MKNALYIPFLVLTGLFLTLPSFAQKEEKKEETEAHRKYQITFAPTKIFSIWSPTLELGFEHKLKNPQHSLLYEFGLIRTHPIHNKNYTYHNSKEVLGFKFKPAYRFYFKENTRAVFQHYISVNYLLRYEDRYRKFRTHNPYNSSYSIIEYNKIILRNGGLINFGFTTHPKKVRVSIGAEMGIGLVNKSISYKNLPENIISESVYEFNADPFRIEKRGNHLQILPNFTFRLYFDIFR